MSVFTQWMARRYGGRAEFYEAFNEPMERCGLAAVRARLADALSGRILEIGCGTGRNFPYYSPNAEVTAIEPLAEYRQFASKRAQTVRARITVLDADAQALPFADGTFTGGLATLVFCSIPDPLRALGEFRRVLRPNAPVRFIEHVRSDHCWVAALQDAVNPLWRQLADGCNINRDTVAAIRLAGFTIDQVEARDIPQPVGPRLPMREITARA